MSLNKFIFILLVSIQPVFCFADTFYGTLRGSETLNIKSPYNGFITLHEKDTGIIHENKVIYSIDNFEYLSKKEILTLKIKNLEEKRKRLMKDYDYSVISFNNGFVSQNELDSKKDVLTEIQITLRELSVELNSINNLLNIGSPMIKKRFIIRDLAVGDQQAVSAGDVLMRLELLDKYYVDIKYDPVILLGKLHNKRITFKSLVNSKISGDAFVHKISNVAGGGDVYGLMTAALVLDTSDDLSSLLDTVLEISIND